MNLHSAAAYATHLLKARSTAGHSVHSPFMFRFITEVIGGRSDGSIIREVESLRKEMLSDRRVVQVRDLGAGSAIIRDIGRGAVHDAEVGDREQNVRQAGSQHKEEEVIRHAESQPGEEQVIRQAGSLHGEERVIRQDAPVQVGERRIRDIAAAAAVPKREAALLARIAGSLDESIREGRESCQRSWQKNYCDGVYREESDNTQRQQEDSSRQKQGVILELGTSLGISTLALALGAPHRRVISIEGCPELAGIARENLLRHGAPNAEVLCMEFGEALDSLKNRGVKVVLAYIDGNHRGAALTEYLKRIREMGEEMILIADDIHMNRDMICAWRSIAEETTAAASGAGPARQATIGRTAQSSGAGPATQPTTRETAPASGAGTAVQPAPGKIASASLETFRMGMLFCLRNLTPGRYRVRY